MKARYFIVTALFFATKACSSSDDTTEPASSGGTQAQGGRAPGGAQPTIAGEGGAGGAPTQPPIAGMGGEETGVGGAQAGAGGALGAAGGSAGSTPIGGEPNAGAAGVAEEGGAGGGPVTCPTSVRYEFVPAAVVGKCAGSTCTIDDDTIVSYCSDPQGRTKYGCEVSIQTVAAVITLNTQTGMAHMETSSTYAATPTALICDAKASIQEPPTEWSMRASADGATADGCPTYKWTLGSLTVGHNIPTTPAPKPAYIGVPLPTCTDQLSQLTVFDGYSYVTLGIQPIRE